MLDMRKRRFVEDTTSEVQKVHRTQLGRTYSVSVTLFARDALY